MNGSLYFLKGMERKTCPSSGVCAHARVRSIIFVCFSERSTNNAGCGTEFVYVVTFVQCYPSRVLLRNFQYDDKLMFNFKF